MFNKQPKVSSELLALTYGVFVTKLLREANDHSPEEVNQQLDQAGYNMGCRMIDEFFARQLPQQGHCKSFKQTIEVLTKQGFKMFLGVVPEVTDWKEGNK